MPSEPAVAANLWGRTVTVPSGVDPETLPASLLYQRTSQPAACQALPATVELTFERSLPVAVNGIAMPFVEIVEVVETIAGDHGVGRSDTALASGVREITEAPAAVTLGLALAEIERTTLAPRLAALKASLSWAYAAAIDDGAWFSTSRTALDAFVTAASAGVSGVVRVQLFRGECRVAEIRRDGRCRNGLVIRGGRALALRTSQPAIRNQQPAGISTMSNLWSGRFDSEPNAAVFDFGRSFRFDRRLFEDDIIGSLAWAEALANAGALSPADAAAITGALTEILAQGQADPQWVSGADEDVHSFVERHLVERIGDAGRRLHTGRSRNEQVSLDLRLFLRRRAAAMQTAHPPPDCRIRRAGRALRPGADACVHAPAACAAGAHRALPAGARGRASPRSRPLRGGRGGG